ncbi:MAG: DUF924 domain-containing protein [Hyphomicrobiales bacterium]|nr:MAG: DUF924 domain-containing protein [Hyphomicrobiales bacterium]
MPHPEATAVLDFWFATGSPEADQPRKAWWTHDDAFDADIRKRFGALHARAVRRDLEDWRAEPETALALVIVLDQFSRNLGRGTPAAFAADPYARDVVKVAIAKGFDKALSPIRRQFFYLPLMHSEHLPDQDHCVALFEALTDLPDQANSLKSALRHREIIARFGRFPHRNAVLGRAAAPDETAFLKEPNSSF